MNYGLAKKLKDTGFPQTIPLDRKSSFIGDVKIPTLSELIEACGDRFEALIRQAGGWVAIHNYEGYMKKNNFKSVESPEHAVINLWLEINKK